MGDLLTHLIDAPVANILILAGLAFLAVGVIGRISGKIEPSQSGRLLSGLLGTLLLVYGLYAHGAADTGREGAKPTAEKPTTEDLEDRTLQGPPQQSLTAALSGAWRNDNSKTRGITRLELQQNGDLIVVHAWGACSPQDCDWGTESGAISAGSATVAWDQGFVLRKMTLTPDAARLRVEVDSVYRDNRPSHHLKEYFVKSQ
jgi:hypothetical protein